jgi:hypothetical protein
LTYTYGAQTASCPDGALDKPHSFTQQNVRYVRDYLNVSTVDPSTSPRQTRGKLLKANVGDTYEWNGSAPAKRQCTG